MTSTPPSDPTIPQRPPSRMLATLRALIRTRVTTGLAVVLPIYVTFLLVKWIFSVMRDSSLWVVEYFLRSPLGQPLLDAWRVPSPPGVRPGVTPTPPAVGQVLISVTEKLKLLEERLGRRANLEEFFQTLPQTIQWGTAICAVLLTVFLLYIIGLFAANIFGRRAIELFDRTIDRVPFVKTVYRSIKQLLAALGGDRTQGFQRVALIPFPQEKMRCVGFITNVFRDSVTNEELCTVFIPTTPNPTTGYLQILKRGELTELNWSIEEGIKTIMSAGTVTPYFITILPNKSLPPDVRRARYDELGPAPTQSPGHGEAGET